MKFNFIFIPILLIFTRCDQGNSEQTGSNEVFIMHFEEGSSIKYDYHVNQMQIFNIDCEEEEDIANMQVDGTLEIKGVSAEQASWLMYDASSKITNIRNGEEDVKTDPNDDAFTAEMTGLKTNGSFTMDDSRINVFHFLFTLPLKDMEEGEIIEEELHFPVNLSASSTSIVGLKTITYEKDTVIDGETCAVLRFAIENKGLEKTMSFTDDSYGVFQGNGVSYFDYTNGQFLGTVSNIYIDVYAELKEKNEYSSCMDMTMDSKNSAWKKK